MRLYEKGMAYYLLYGIILTNALLIAIVAHFIHRFLLIERSADGWLLVGMFGGMLVLCDILFWRIDIIKRIFGKVKFDEEGALCYGFLMRKTRINWDDICIYGVIGESVGYLLIFLSTDPNEKTNRQTKAAINRKRVVFSARDEVISNLKEYLPEEMFWRIKRAVNNKTDCYYKRVIHKM